MALEATWKDEDGYRRVCLRGDPSLGQILSYLELMAVETSSAPRGLLLVDLRGITSLTGFTEQFTLGERAASKLGHLHKLASLVPPGRRTRNSERTARAAGFNLRVFEDEGEAIAWLRGS
ncbi:MAG TPA: hypothetical protein VHA82_17185 [Ramlibacter sp.]|uniref:hypothetical protein n=1 Tax=Ramlibacter sp. TaxID=1917967 RepID=UPI002BA9979F|nr:hypothetical protein [Ramlibacter sp.]HVZ45547.1 hypothetical protein [Ramlibacter sp.]